MSFKEIAFISPHTRSRAAGLYFVQSFITGFKNFFMIMVLHGLSNQCLKLYTAPCSTQTALLPRAAVFTAGAKKRTRCRASTRQAHITNTHAQHKTNKDTPTETPAQ
jgi:hypothetical protein